MAERYGAFLVRCWHRADGEWRVVVEHVQSAQRARFTSLAAASAWLQTQLAAANEGAARDDGRTAPAGDGANNGADW
jgi:hypothetical protein